MCQKLPTWAHAGITTTMDVYGHLMGGSEDEAVHLIDAYLARADTANRVAAVRRRQGAT